MAELAGSRGLWWGCAEGKQLLLRRRACAREAVVGVETRRHLGPCIFLASLLRSDMFSLPSCAGLGSPQGPSCLETFPHWSDFGMDDTHSDSPDEPAEPLGGRREMQ